MSTEILDDLAAVIVDLLDTELVSLIEHDGRSTATLQAELAQLAQLGYLESSRDTEEGFGLASDCVLLEEFAKRWGSLAWSIVPTMVNNRLPEQPDLDAETVALAFASPATWRDAVIDVDDATGDVSITGTLRYVLNAGLSTRLIAFAPATSSLYGRALVIDGIPPSSRPSATSLEGFTEAVHGDVELNGGALTATVAGAADEYLAALRILMAAVSSGLAVGALALGVQYAKDRTQFGRPIGAYGEIRSIIAQGSARAQLVSVSVRSASADWDAGTGTGLAAIQTLLSGTELAALVAERMQHVHGGYGQMAEYDIGRFVRDARAIEAFDTPLPVLEDAIADQWGLPR